MLKATPDIRRRRRIRTDASGVVIKAVGYGVVTLFTLLCIIPFYMMVVASFSTERQLLVNGYRLYIQEPTLFAYKLVFENPDKVIGSYVLTILLTFIGTAAGLLGTAMAGYALQRPDFDYRNKISMFIYFTTLFSGGIVAYYLLMTQFLHLKNNYLALLLPGLFSPFNVFIMRNFMRSIPHSVTESALIDGAGDFKILLRIIIPMSTPALATLGLFIALGYWNEWYNALLFLPNTKYRPLQFFLYNIITKQDYIKNSAAASHIRTADVPLETMKMACAMITTGPVLLFYPFVQRYFIKGITIGAVKG
ncbi:MAG: carbohydrate ABC transporter permease [Clostridiales bacterium]|nr:carbohydrate ABC transporter permease [Clostridiales bacterium]